MIAARANGANGSVIIMLVLEPGNIEKLKQGEPIHKFLNEFMPELRTSIELVFAYSPDVDWVAKQMGGSKDALRLAELILESLDRKEVIIRDSSAERMKKQQ